MSGFLGNETLRRLCKVEIIGEVDVDRVSGVEEIDVKSLRIISK